MNRLVFIFYVCLSGCTAREKLYQITVDGVTSRSKTITEFSISQFKKDHLDESDIRPNEHNELMRYCCKLSVENKGKKMVFFGKDTPNYTWSLCKLDTSLAMVDSLSNLTVLQKLSRLKSRDSLKISINDENLKLPFVVQNGYVYQIFGLEKMEGSYYFCFNSEGKLIIQFVDKGPW